MWFTNHVPKEVPLAVLKKTSSLYSQALLNS